MPIIPDIFNPHPGCCPDAQAQEIFRNLHQVLPKGDFRCPIFSSMENAGKNKKIDPDLNKKLFMLQQKSSNNNSMSNNSMSNNIKILLWRLQSLHQDLRISEPKVKIQGRPKLYDFLFCILAIPKRPTMSSSARMSESCILRTKPIVNYHFHESFEKNISFWEYRYLRWKSHFF